MKFTKNKEPFLKIEDIVMQGTHKHFYWFLQKVILIWKLFDTITARYS